MGTDAGKARPVYHHRPEDDCPIRFIGDVFTIKATADATAGAYSVTEMTVSPTTEGPPPHHHESCEEAFYIVAGHRAHLAARIRKGVRANG